MSKKISNSKHGVTRVSVAAPDAREVHVAGSFNGWDPSSTPLARNGSDQWTAQLQLSPGRHEYKFVVDGQWCCEPGCDRAYSGCPTCTPNPFGTMNRVLTVE
jgi:1,4-alpha-glucan branching enzyme